jgi:Fic family protein
MRTFEQTHPWISFRWEPRRIPYPIWLLLGEAGALMRTLNQAALPVTAASEMDRTSRVQSLHALAAMEGNTLTETQVEQCLGPGLRLPASQAYLSVEILNLQKALQWTEDRLRAEDRQFTPWSVQLLNAQVLKGLPWEEEVVPGDYRTVRQSRVQGGAPAEDIGFLMDRLSEWLSAERFAPEHQEERIAFSLVRGFLAQLYLLWIRPFAEGNLWTAWLVTHQFLLEAGLPPLAISGLVSHIGRARNAWLRESTSAAHGSGDPIPFIAFMSRGLVEALRELVTEVEEQQHQALLGGHLHQLFAADRTANGARRLRLMMALSEQAGSIPAARIAHLSPELAKLYARLDRKTLLRDLAYLQEQGMLQRDPSGVRIAHAPLRSFRSLVPE